MEIWQKIVMSVGVFLVAGFVVWGFFLQETSAPTNVDIKNGDLGNPNAPVVYYYGDGCPHCEELQKFLDKEGVVYGEKLAKKEVWKNTTNNKEMMKKADLCNLEKENVGVPFVFAEDKCFIGAEAKKYFESSSFMKNE
ncbi:MAG: hypothetical protein IPN70_01815 [Candidatus Moraniibacteriota bacterium]|nr:MAG: hypothetical protein IPN70_01815 [Candidatus Moranbacteria bacterium]